uniref:CARD domain-containing protein n=1 Tax=Knipowitschia caucasica TaxID=637954 RepID=A0AAV2MFW2_KNICA
MGQYECSVSGLRWSCEEKVSFDFKFGLWEEHMERVQALQYMPAGPLIDVTVTSGRLDEVYLRHWVCVDDPDLAEEFRVLHVEDRRDTVEEATTRVSNVAPILDRLKSEGVISDEAYDTIRHQSTPQDKMRELFRGPLRSSGDRGKDIFYRILRDKEPFLCKDLDNISLLSTYALLLLSDPAMSDSDATPGPSQPLCATPGCKSARLASRDDGSIRAYL